MKIEFDTNEESSVMTSILNSKLGEMYLRDTLYGIIPIIWHHMQPITEILIRHLEFEVTNTSFD